MVVLAKAWEQFTYHKEQSDLWRSSARFKVVCAGRGSGKTALAKKYIVRMCPVRKRWSNSMYLYGMPTYRQAKRVAWVDIQKLMPKRWCANISESDMRIDTIFGSSIYVMGMDKPERAEGVQWDGVILDESSDIKPGVFQRSILPALSHKDGFCWRIGVPKRYGAGALEFREAFDNGITDGSSESFHWTSASILPEEKLEELRGLHDEKDFQEQFEAKWINAGGSIFHAFDIKKNVVDAIQYCPQLPLFVSSDFNVDPMCWIIGHVYKGCIFVIDELFIRNTNTPATLNELYKKYGHHKGGFEFYGDAAARARHTSTSTTDYAYIVDDNRFEDKKVYYLKSNPRRADRFASCNRLFESADKINRLFIHPRCKRLIRDLQLRSYAPNSREPDDSGDIGHITDALGYVVYRRFPMSIKVTSALPNRAAFRGDISA